MMSSFCTNYYMLFHSSTCLWYNCLRYNQLILAKHNASIEYNSWLLTVKQRTISGGIVAHICSHHEKGNSYIIRVQCRLDSINGNYHFNVQ